jgi:hypothetical protein
VAAELVQAAERLAFGKAPAGTLDAKEAGVREGPAGRAPRTDSPPEKD